MGSSGEPLSFGVVVGAVNGEFVEELAFDSEEVATEGGEALFLESVDDLAAAARVDHGVEGKLDPAFGERGLVMGLSKSVFEGSALSAVEPDGPGGAGLFHSDTEGGAGLGEVAVGGIDCLERDAVGGEGLSVFLEGDTLLSLAEREQGLEGESEGFHAWRG